MELPFVFDFGFMLLLIALYFVGYVLKQLFTPLVEKIPPSKRRAVFWSIPLIGFLILLLVGLSYRSNSTPPQQSFSTPTATKTNKPIPTRTKQPTLTKEIGIANCYWWYEVTDSSIGSVTCVQGIVSDITGNTETSDKTRIYFNANGSVYIVDDGYYYAGIGIGDCVYSVGLLRITNDGDLFLQADGKLQSCSQ